MRLFRLRLGSLLSGKTMSKKIDQFSRQNKMLMLRFTSKSMFIGSQRKNCTFSTAPNGVRDFKSNRADAILADCWRTFISFLRIARFCAIKQIFWVFSSPPVYPLPISPLKIIRFVNEIYFSIYILCFNWLAFCVPVSRASFSLNAEI